MLTMKNTNPTFVLYDDWCMKNKVKQLDSIEKTLNEFITKQMKKVVNIPDFYKYSNDQEMLETGPKNEMLVLHTKEK